MSSAKYSIYTYPENPRVYKILACATYAGQQCSVPPFEMPTIKSPSFLSRFPHGQVPVIETPDGPLFESNAIAKYFCRLGNVLYGKSPYEASSMDAWIDWAVGKLSQPGMTWLLPIAGIRPFVHEETEAAKQQILSGMALMNKHLEARTYLIGESISVADICIASELMYLYRSVFSPAFRKPFPNVTRWFETVINQPEYQKNMSSPFQMAKEMAVAPAAAAKAAAPASQADADAPKKEVNPLDLLPPSKLVMDEWKRMFCNNPASVSLPFFWDHYEPSGWSIWSIEYKYNSELTRSFMVKNLVNGFIQRCDGLRPYGFGVLYIMGVEHKHEITGIFLVRGTELPRELRPEQVDDVASYDWKQLHPESSAEDKKFVETYFSQPQELPGRSNSVVYDCLIFK